MIAEDLRPAAQALLAEAGFAGSARFTHIDGGGNNQVYRAECDGRLAALKVYFHHPQDQRDRLNAEYSFSRLLWDHGVKGVPQGVDGAFEHTGVCQIKLIAFCF